MRFLLLFAFFFNLHTLKAKTFDFSDRFGVGGGAGYAFPIQGNRFDDFAEDEVMWELHARYNFTPEDIVQFNISHYEFENTSINARVYDLLYLNRINEGDKLTPFVGIGAGVAEMDNIAPFNDGLKFSARFRLGLEYALTDDLVASIFGDYQYVGKLPYNSEDKDDDDEGFPGQEIFALVPQIGLTYYFGPDKEMHEKSSQEVATLDDDRDGVSNSLDKCPGTDPGKIVNSYGCLEGEVFRE
jgi:hypothetical protein